MKRNGHPAGRMDYRDETVSLVEIAGREGVIDGVTFTDCKIEGPAVILIQGDFEIYANYIDGSPEAFLWTLPNEQEAVIGAILVKECTFRGCTFTNVGIAGHSAVIDEIRHSLTTEPAPT